MVLIYASKLIGYFMIQPPAVTLSGNESVKFESDATTWVLSPGKGAFDPTTRIYKSPFLIFNSRKIFLTSFDPAHPGSGGTAEITLNSSLSWLGILAIYWPLVIVAIGLLVRGNWPGIPAQPVLMVNPPNVTVGSAQTQQFSAGLNDVAYLDATWSATAGTITSSGLFSPPAIAGQPDQIVTVTATRNDDKTKAATATVVVTQWGLFLYPAVSHARKGETIQLTASAGPGVTIQWPVNAPAGKYTAPAKIDQPSVVTISVSDTANARHTASARIFLVPDNPDAASNVPSDIDLISLAIAAGALGAWLASVKSFVGFTGNRTFAPSWAFFYLFRPMFGAGLALVAHMAHRSGNLGSTATASDPTVVIFYSALVGLFADEALQKLHDIFCAAFGVQDTRKDKMNQANQQTPAASPGTPTITRATATTGSRNIAIQGGNFVSLPTVFVDGVARAVTFTDDKNLTVALDAAPALGQTLQIKVRNPDGKESAVFSETVAA